MRNRFLQFVLALVVLLTSVTVAGPAQASSGDCPTSFTCTWNGTSFAGTPAFSHTMPSAFGACVNISAINGANNNADSVYNRNSFQVSFYDDFGGGGYLFSLAAGASIANLSAAVENRASSICHE
jgi:hypothetical protein